MTSCGGCRQAFPALPMVVNGGLREPRAVLEALTWCDGVMLGREAYHRPYVLAELHAGPASGAPRGADRAALIERMARYAERELAAGGRLAPITRHMLGLYAGEPGARELPPCAERGRARTPGRLAATLLRSGPCRACI